MRYYFLAVQFVAPGGGYMLRNAVAVYDSPFRPKETLDVLAGRFPNASVVITSVVEIDEYGYLEYLGSVKPENYVEPKKKGPNLTIVE